MKIICAGYPKTGSKSCSAALRVLGYNVCDFMETLEFASDIWEKYFHGQASIEDVLDVYDKHGFDANQDIPGNFLWEELYRASPPDTKVILTIRESEDKWWNSFFNFILGSNMWNYRMTSAMAPRGWMGPKFQSMFKVQRQIKNSYLGGGALNDGLTLTGEKLSKLESRMKKDYIKHNLYVQSIVPKENLLVWNLKDGWDPLCDFLNLPVPDQPIPHDNKTGDTEFLNRIAFHRPVFKNAVWQLKKNLVLSCLKASVCSYIIFWQFKTHKSDIGKFLCFIGNKLK